MPSVRRTIDGRGRLRFWLIGALASALITWRSRPGTLDIEPDHVSQISLAADSGLGRAIIPERRSDSSATGKRFATTSPRARPHLDQSGKPSRPSQRGEAVADDSGLATIAIPKSPRLGHERRARWRIVRNSSAYTRLASMPARGSPVDRFLSPHSSVFSPPSSVSSSVLRPEADRLTVDAGPLILNWAESE